MTLAADLNRHVVAKTYEHAGVVADHTYRANAQAQIDAARTAAEARLTAERAAQMPTIVDAPEAKPDPSAVVSITRPQAPDGKQAAPSQAVTPLPQANVDAFLAEHRRYDPEGTAALQREWGADTPTNLAYAGRWLANHLTTEQRDRLTAEGFDVLPLIRLVAGFGREEAHTAPTITTGKTTMAETLTKPAAEKRYRELTTKIHDARFRGDHMAVRELDAERVLLGEALYPGSSEPDSNHRRVI